MRQDISHTAEEFDIAKLEGMDEKLLDQYKLLMDAQKNNQIGYCSWTFYPSEMRVYMNENTDALFLGYLPWMIIWPRRRRI